MFRQSGISNAEAMLSPLNFGQSILNDLAYLFHNDAINANGITNETL
jgi:hypothetical protein